MTNAGNEPPQLRRALGLVALTFFGIGDILGAGVYGLMGRVAGMTGTAAWASCLVAGLAAALTGLVYAELSSRYPKAGGAAYFCHIIFKKRLLTFLVTISIALSGIFSAAASARIISNYALALAPGVPDVFRIYVIPAAFILLLAAIAARGIVISSAANIVCTVIEFSGLAVIILLGIRFLGAVNYVDLSAVQSQSAAPWLILSGASLVFYAFIGFEDLANLTEEVRRPERTVPLAICIAIGVTTTVYCLIALIAVSVITPRLLDQSSSPLIDVVRAAAPEFPLWFYSVIPAFAAFNTALMNLVMASRLLYGMSHGHSAVLPGFFARIHPRWKTPAVSVGIAMAIMLAIIACFRDTSTLASGTSIFLLVVFILLNVALLRIKFDENAPRAPFPVPKWVPALSIVICAGLLLRQEVTAIRAALMLGLTAFVLYVIRELFPKRMPKSCEEQPQQDASND